MSTSTNEPDPGDTSVDLEAEREREAAALVEDDPLRASRALQGTWKWIARAIGVFFALYYLIRSGFIGPGSPQLHRGMFVGVSCVLIFLIYPASQKAFKRKQENEELPLSKVHAVPFYDVILALGAATFSAYFATQLPAMATRSGAPNDTDVLMGVLGVVLVLEVCRRTVGWFLPIMGMIAIAYIFVGQWMPGMFAHPGYSFTRFTGIMFTSFNGIFGIVASIFANFVFLFIIFGTVLSKSGAAKFFTELPYSMAGTMRGGPAKVALLVSAIMGSINGSAVANVMTTGTFSIPLMKRVGYRKEFAGGVEAAASTGGGILPPIMGAGAFILAEFTGIPYSTVVLYSIVPALMYFAGVYFLVDFEALKDDLEGLPRSELPNPWTVFKQGWYYFLPLVTVFWLIIVDYSPAFAGFWGTVAAAAVGLIPYHGERMKPYDFMQVLWDSSFRTLPIAGVVGTLGIIIGAMNLTGLGLKFSAIVVAASGGSLLAAVILVTVASWILGAGLTVTTSYVIVAILAAPALTELGVSLLAAHLIILWVSQDANVTPPICVAAFAAASIAGGRLMRTGWEAWKLARGLYIIPLLMAYTPLVDGPFTEILHIALTGTLGIYFFCASVAGYLVRKVTWLERVILFGASVLLISPQWSTNFAGAAVGFGVFFWEKFTIRRAKRTEAEAAGASVGADEGASSSEQG